jgi:chromosome segregation ATPase
MRNWKLPLDVSNGTMNGELECRSITRLVDADRVEIAAASGNEAPLRFRDIADACNQHEELIERKGALEVERNLLSASLVQADETIAHLERQLSSQRTIIRAHQVLITDLERRLAKLVDGNQSLIDDLTDARRGQAQTTRENQRLVKAMKAIKAGAQVGEQLPVLEDIATQALDDTGAA